MDRGGPMYDPYDDVRQYIGEQSDDCERYPYKQFWCSTCQDWTPCTPFDLVPTCADCGDTFLCGDCGYEIDRAGNCQRYQSTGYQCGEVVK